MEITPRASTLPSVSDRAILSCTFPVCFLIASVPAAIQAYRTEQIDDIYRPRQARPMRGGTDHLRPRAELTKPVGNKGCHILMDTWNEKTIRFHHTTLSIYVFRRRKVTERSIQAWKMDIQDPAQPSFGPGEASLAGIG